MMQNNNQLRCEVHDTLRTLEENHTDLENFHLRTINYVKSILLNKEVFELNPLVVNQLEIVVSLSESIRK